MISADDILQPHSFEVLAAIVQRKIAEAEEVFPGLIQKVRKWIVSDDFKRVLKEVPVLTEKSFRMSSAPGCMMGEIALVLAGLKPIWQFDDRSNMIEWIANYIWETEEMSKRFYEYSIGNPE